MSNMYAGMTGDQSQRSRGGVAQEQTPGDTQQVHHPLGHYEGGGHLSDARALGSSPMPDVYKKKTPPTTK